MNIQCMGMCGTIFCELVQARSYSLFWAPVSQQITCKRVFLLTGIVSEILHPHSHFYHKDLRDGRHSSQQCSADCCYLHALGFFFSFWYTDYTGRRITAIA